LTQHVVRIRRTNHPVPLLPGARGAPVAPCSNPIGRGRFAIDSDLPWTLALSFQVEQNTSYARVVHVAVVFQSFVVKKDRLPCGKQSGNRLIYANRPFRNVHKLTSFSKWYLSAKHEHFDQCKNVTLYWLCVS
jgi:hypothetical protein